MAESYEIYRAGWNILYPVGCEMVSIPDFLRPFTYVEHKLEAFPWHLVGQLVHHLENPNANFEYLHITKYCVARAAELALKGDVLNHSELHTALSKNQVQFGGIYRNHLIRVFRNFLEKNNIAKLPECDIHTIDPLHGSGQVAKNRDLLLCLIQTAEFDYTNTLIFLSLDPEKDEKIFDQTSVYWGQGGGMPEFFSVDVVVTPHATGYFIHPCKGDAKQMTCARRRMQRISVRNQEEFPFVNDSVDREKNAAGDSGYYNGEAEEKIIGDYRVIRVAGGKRINLAMKHKARGFLGFVHRALIKAGQKDFYVEEMRDAFNAQYTGEMSGKQWKSDRFREDLFKDKEREFDLLFEPLERGSGYYCVFRPNRPPIPILAGH